MSLKQSLMKDELRTLRINERKKKRGHFIAFIFVFISRVKLREISFHTVYVILEMI